MPWLQFTTPYYILLYIYILAKLLNFFLKEFSFRSCWSNPHVLTVVRAFNRSGSTRAVALNILKAFDRAWDASLLYKYKSNKIQVQYLTLFCLLLVIDGLVLLWMGSSYKIIYLILGLFKTTFKTQGSTPFLLSIISLIMFFVILPSMMMILLPTLRMIRLLVATTRVLS